MNKTKLTSIFLIILIALFATGCTKQVKDKVGMESSGDKEAGGEVQDVQGKLADILKLGKPVKCTGTFESEDGNVDMTVYASGKKSLTEMNVDNEDGKGKVYSLYDGDWMYMWTDIDSGDEDTMNMATKMKVSDLEDMASDLPDSGDYAAQGNQEAQAFNRNLDYKCRVWIPNAAKFNPPTDIEFMDLTEMMQGFTRPGAVEDMMEMSK